MNDLISVLIIGAPSLAPEIVVRYQHNAKGFEIHHLDDDQNLESVLVERHPQVIVTVGDRHVFKRLWAAPLEIRKRWLHFDQADKIKVGDAILHCYVTNAMGRTFKEMPLVSVITPTYKTGKKILRPFESLLRQTYNNWEWIIFDDSDDQTFEEMCCLAKKDHRISVYKSHRHCGVIGELKHRASMLAKGECLVELDHDDELTSNCLGDVVRAFAQFSDAGFAYTDCAEVFEDGANASYDIWAFGYGSYRNETYGGRTLLVTNYPNVNSKTIRHIVGVPNHVRAWRKKDYLEIGGHGREIHVCDDYELILRTFLKTRMVKIPKLGYIQYLDRKTQSNAQRKRNAEIQRLVQQFVTHYEDRIHKRFLELGVDDYIWTPKGLNWGIPNKDPESFANYTSKT